MLMRRFRQFRHTLQWELDLDRGSPARSGAQPDSPTEIRCTLMNIE